MNNERLTVQGVEIEFVNELVGLSFVFEEMSLKRHPLNINFNDKEENERTIPSLQFHPKFVHHW